MDLPARPHRITFPLYDHLLACLAPCFPSHNVDPSLSPSSSVASFPRDFAEALLPSDHPENENDDAAAWGSDAVSLRSRLGRGASSREANRRSRARGWIWNLLLGRRGGDIRLGDAERERIEAEWEDDGVRSEDEAEEERALAVMLAEDDQAGSTHGGSGGTRDDAVSVHSRRRDQLIQAQEEEDDGWGAYKAAPLSSTTSESSHSHHRSTTLQPQPTPSPVLPISLPHPGLPSLLSPAGDHTTEAETEDDAQEEDEEEPDLGEGYFRHKTRAAKLIAGSGSSATTSCVEGSNSSRSTRSACSSEATSTRPTSERGAFGLQQRWASCG